MQQQNNMENTGVGGGKRRELILDTQGICFLCLEEISTSSKASKREPALKDVCLRNICRLLKINQSQILINAFNLTREGGENEDVVIFTRDSMGGNHCDFSVLLCPACASLTQELSAYIRQMEIIKLLMGQHLLTFQQILTATEEEIDNFGDPLSRRSRGENLRKESMEVGGNSAIEAQLVTHLRKDIVMKCSAKVAQLEKACVPRVSLPRLDLSVCTTNDGSGGFHKVSSSSNHFHQNKRCDSDDYKKTTNDSRKDNQISLLDEREASHFFTELVSNYSKQSGAKGNFTCTLCNKNLRHCNLQPHLINQHPEKFFMSCRLSHVTEATFKTFCLKILSLEDNICKDSQENPTYPRNNSIQCVHCHHNSINGFQLRSHLVLNHSTILQKKLIKTQNESGFPVTLEQLQRQRQKIKRIKPIVWKCNNDDRGGGCGRIFSSNYHLNRHKKENCALRKHRMALKCKIDAKSGGCGRIFSSDYHLNRHKKEKCTLRKHRMVLKCKIDAKSGGCGRIFSSNYHLNRHKEENCPLRKHRMALKCKNDVSGGGCGRTFSGKATLNHHKNHYCPFRLHKTEWKCVADGKSDGCGRTFSGKASLNHHKNHYCPFRPHKTEWKCVADGKSDGCGRTFSGKASLNHHKNHYCPFRPHKTEWKCVADGKSDGCGRTFSGKVSLNRHKKVTCQMRKNKNASVCSIDMSGKDCGKTLSGKEMLNRHQNHFCPVQLHKTEWKCVADAKSGGCGQKFSTKGNLFRHKSRSCLVRKE